jgi:hypothetical protein
VRLVRRAGVALVLVTLGRLLSPAAVPVYDGLGAPDEPYRYAAPPAGTGRTAPPTTATATSPLVNGRTRNGLSVTSAENGPQVSVYLPVGALASSGSSVVVTATPVAPTDQPPGGRIDGNVYDVAFRAAGPVTLTSSAALAQITLRATTPPRVPPVMEHRSAAGQPWQPLKTVRFGFDIYTSDFTGPGQYALAVVKVAPQKKGASPTPYLLLGGVVLLVAVVVVVRLRATG